MPTPPNGTSPEERAELSKTRARAASYIADPEKRKAFIAEQGKSEGFGLLDAGRLARMKRHAEDTIATEGKNFEGGAKSPLASYRKGTKRVPRTGQYKLHKNEAVLPVKKANAYRKGGLRGKA